LDPIIRFRATATKSRYDAREIEVNAASFKRKNPQLQIALAPSLQPGHKPTLASLNAARSLLDRDSTIDRGLALMDQIDAAAPTADTVGTFAVRRAYWRMVALFKACTRSFYQTCDDAETALEGLRKAIAASPGEFALEGVTEQNIAGLDARIRAARINKTVHRGNWYLELKELSRAREEYQAARDELAKGGKDLEKEVGVTLSTLDGNLKLVDEREKGQP
jgi:hypothetical protein